MTQLQVNLCLRTPITILFFSRSDLKPDKAWIFSITNRAIDHSNKFVTTFYNKNKCNLLKMNVLLPFLKSWIRVNSNPVLKHLLVKCKHFYCATAGNATHCISTRKPSVRPFPHLYFSTLTTANTECISLRTLVRCSILCAPFTVIVDVCKLCSVCRRHQDRSSSRYVSREIRRVCILINLSLNAYRLPSHSTRIR